MSEEHDQPGFCEVLGRGPPRKGGKERSHDMVPDNVDYNLIVDFDMTEFHDGEAISAEPELRHEQMERVKDSTLNSLSAKLDFFFKDGSDEGPSKAQIERKQKKGEGWNPRYGKNTIKKKDGVISLREIVRFTSVGKCAHPPSLRIARLQR